MPEIILSDYFYGDESEEFVYFKIPRQLITNPKWVCLIKNDAQNPKISGSHRKMKPM